MIEIAPDVYLLRGIPDYLINVYLVGDVLIDAGTRMATPGLLRQLKGHRLSTHALTHVHPDHQGATKAVCETFGVPLAVGEVDAPAMESGDMTLQIPHNTITRLQNVFWTGPAHPVDRTLQEGDVVAGFTVLDTPGHSPGHIAYWRESDHVLILGDVANNLDFMTLTTRLGEPPQAFTVDPIMNQQSARKLAALNPRVVCFGHGKPIYDGTQFVDFVQSLPQGDIAPHHNLTSVRDKHFVAHTL